MLSIGGMTGVAEWSVLRIRGEKCLGLHRVLLDLELRFLPRKADDQVILSDLVASISAEGSAGAGVLTSMRPVEDPYLAPSAQTPLTTHVTLAANLSPRSVEALESVRMGGPLTLTGTIRARVFRQGQQFHVSDSLTYPIEQGVWVRVLGEMQFRRTLLIEIPIPNPDSTPDLLNTVEHLEKAQDAMLRGDWRATVGCCRDVLESLRTALNAIAREKPEIPGPPVEGKTLSKEARFRRLARSVQDIASLAMHSDELGQETEWERCDARAILAAASALVSRYSASGQ